MDDDEIRRIYYEEYIGKHYGGTKLKSLYGKSFYKDFHRLSLQLRNNHEKNRLYTCDEQYFEHIDTEEKAYWLGFIYADGYVSRVNNSMRFGLSIMNDDIDHLRKFQKAISTDTPIHEYTVTSSGYKIGAKYCRIIIANDKFANNLVNQGCYEHKTKILEPPRFLPKDLEKHFIRGFLDGDGSITQNNSKYGLSYTIRWTSTDSMLLWIMSHLIDHDIIQHPYKLYKRRKTDTVSSFEFGGNNLTKKFLDYIYNGASIWLDRKHNRYLSLCDIINKREKKIIPQYCDVCGTTKSPAFHKLTRDDEYNGKVVCEKHYLQLYRHNRIIPDRKCFCEMCGDTYGKMILVGSTYPEYHGITMCRRHYEQLTTGVSIDHIVGKHKNLEAV